MGTLVEYSDLLGQIYDAAVDSGRWPAVLERLAGRFDASQVVLSTEDIVQRSGATLAFGADPAFVRSYLDYYMYRNPLSERTADVPSGSVVTDRMILPKDEFQRTEFRNDFLRPQDVETCLTGIAVRNRAQSVILALWRPKRGEEWGRPEFDLLSRLTPHLRRAVEVKRRLDGVRFEQAMALDALDRLYHGVVLLQNRSRLSFVNRAAAAILARADGLAANGTGLRAALQSEDAALQRLIGRAVVGDGIGVRSGGTLALSRPSGSRPFVVHVMPSRVETDIIIDRCSGALVLIVDPECAPRMVAAHLQDVYGLTPAEAAVATCIVRGQGLQAVAEELRVTLSTVRIHLQRVFEKTRTHRQAELVRVLLHTQAGIRSDGPMA